MLRIRKQYIVLASDEYTGAGEGIRSTGKGSLFQEKSPCQSHGEGEAAMERKSDEAAERTHPKERKCRWTGQPIQGSELGRCLA